MAILEKIRDRGAASALLFCGIFLAFPLAWVWLFAPSFGAYWPRFGVFDNGVLALFATELLLFTPAPMVAFLRRREPADLFVLLSLGLLFLTLSIQQFHLFSVFFFTSGLLPIALLLFGACRAEELKKILPKFALALLILGTAQFASDLYFHYVCGLSGHVIAGLASNWNWSAGLLVVSALLAAPLLPEKHRTFPVLTLVLAAATLFACLLVPDLPKGMIAGAAAALLALGALRFPEKFTFKAAIFGVLALFLLGATAVFTHGDRIARFLEDDVRPELYHASLALALDRLPFGCGQDRFVGQINPYLRPVYHLSPVAANIHDHPHNEFLLFFAENGIAGLVFAAALLVIAAGAFRRLRGRFDFTDWAVFAAFTVFAVHAMFDMTVSVWPNRLLAFLLAGLLWRQAGGDVRPAAVENAPLFRIAGVFAALACALLLAMTSLGGFFLWRASHLDDQRLDASGKGFDVRPLTKPAAQASYRASLRFRPTEKALYALAVNEFYYFRNYRRVLAPLLALEKIGCDGYIHSDYLAARAFAELGQWEKSLHYYGREEVRYPFGSVVLYDHSYALARLGRKSEAAEKLEACRITLAMKGLQLADLPLLRANPSRDFRIPQDKVRALRAGAVAQ